MNVAPLAKTTLGLGMLYVGLKLLQPRMNRWGATPDEHRSVVPGGDLVKDAKIGSTHAITIDAPPSMVWPWLLQIGQNRGGFYSYAWLENLVGCKLQNVDRIVPDFQNLKKGDHVWLHPKAPPLEVTYIEPERGLALEGWIFELRPTGMDQTRLISRTYDLPRDPKMGRIGNGILHSVFFDLAHLIMGRKMLKTIKSLAEQAAGKESRAWYEASVNVP